MTARDLLDAFSGALISDGRILTGQEQQLLASLLRRVTSDASDQAAVGTIKRAVGEIVAERAYVVLGESITRKLIDQPQMEANFPPPSPGPMPPNPGPPGPGAVLRGKANLDFPPPSPGPMPPNPGPPGPGSTRVERELPTSGVGVLDIPEFLPAHCLVFDEFLAPAELDALVAFTLEHESAFQVSEVVAPGVVGGSVDYEHRRSRVLMNLGKHEAVIVDRIRACWPRILSKLGQEDFPVSLVEAQITASNDGDFFHWHTDNGHPETVSREITFVYFFHREPKAFQGGELRVYDSKLQNGSYVATQNYRTIVPQQNQMVLFNSRLAHEIIPVACPSRSFADSRFTVNGWFRR